MNNKNNARRCFTVIAIVFAILNSVGYAQTDVYLSFSDFTQDDAETNNSLVADIGDTVCAYIWVADTVEIGTGACFDITTSIGGVVEITDVEVFNPDIEVASTVIDQRWEAVSAGINQTVESVENFGGGVVGTGTGILTNQTSNDVFVDQLHSTDNQAFLFARVELSVVGSGNTDLSLSTGHGGVYNNCDDVSPSFGSVSLTASLPNEPPTAVAGVDQSIHGCDTVNLDGTASFDDNTASLDLDYAWSFFSTPGGSAATLTNANTSTPSFVADLTGTYVVQLVVTDESGLSSNADQVEISSNNLAPTAVATVDFSLAIIDQPVNFDGATSMDPDLDPLTYVWTITTKPAGSTAVLVGASTANPSLTPDLEGDYEVTLTVSDCIGAGTPDTVCLTATTASGFAEIQIVNASDAVGALLPAEVTTAGNQNAFGNFLAQAISRIQSGDITGAIDKLNKAIERTDGCALRGSPDGPGPGRDWVTDCDAQMEIYDVMTAAVDAL